MKKLLSSILALVMLLSLIPAALAAPVLLEEAGISLEVPEGMTATDQSDENGYVLYITVDDNEALVYAYYLGYSEELAGKQFEDLSDEEGMKLVESLTTGMENPSYSAVEQGDLAILVVENGDATMAHMVALFDGWLLDTVVGKSDGVPLTEEEITQAVAMLMSIQFVGEADSEVAQ